MLVYTSRLSGWICKRVVEIIIIIIVIIIIIIIIIEACII